MKKILLTGASGFIGRNILESYLSSKYIIIAPSRLELNLLNDDQLDIFFARHNFEVIIHCAARPGHRNTANPHGIFYDNSRMFFNLLKNSNNFAKLINIGSGAIYGMNHYRPKMKEEYFGTYIADDEHGFCKYVIGKYTQNLDNVVDLRIFGIFGKYEDYAIRFISNAICKTIFDLPITIKQNRKFDYLYIDDLMPILEFFIENDNKFKAYNVTPDTSIELLEIANIINSISNKNLEIKIASDLIGKEYSGDNERLKKEIKDWRLTKIEDAIAKLYEWYLTHKSYIKREFLLTDK
jgi:UDP-glucose 4-epimerase